MIAARLLDAARYGACTDAVVRRALAELGTFTGWLTANNAAGYIGECGWPWSRDSAAWNNVAREYLHRLAQVRLFYSVYGASGHFHANQLGQYTDKGGTGDVLELTVARPSSAVSEAYNHPIGYSCTVPDPDFGTGTLPSNGGLFSNFNPGTIGVDYFYPSVADLQFLARRRVKIIRLTFQWERLQPTLLGALNATELSRITDFLAAAAASGMRAILVPHNFAGYKIGTSNTSMAQYYLSTDTTKPLTSNHFTDFWNRLSTALQGSSALYGYSLMNEPTGIDAITGPYGPNLVGTGTFESGAEGWTGTGAAVAQTTAQAHSGSHALSFTVTSAGNAGAFSLPFAVAAGTTYAASCFIRAGTTVRKAAINIDWHDSNNVYLSSASGTQISDSTSAWTLLNVVGTAPALAARANITVKAYASAVGEISYLDDVVCQTSTIQSSAQQWQVLTQLALDAIRANDSSSVIMVPGYDYSHAHTWQTNHPAAWINDAAHNFCYEAHHYWDSDHSGTYQLSYAQELSNAQAGGY